MELTLSGDFAEKIWVPDTFFANDKFSFLHEVTEKNKVRSLAASVCVAAVLYRERGLCWTQRNRSPT